MIKVIKNSTNLSTWYLDPGVPTDGDGKSFDNPFVWQLHSSNDNKNFDYTAPEYGNYVYVLLKLTSGTTYNGNIVAHTGPITYQLYDNDDQNTVLKTFSYYDSTSFSFSVDKTGLYIFKCGEEFYNNGSTETLTLNPSPDIISGEAVWKKKEGLAKGEGWNKKTGKMFKYRNIENAGIKYNDYINGLLYWDSNTASSISSFDDAVNKFQTGANGPIFTTKFNLVDGEGTLISGYTDYFIVKMKGYIKIENPGTYKFFTNQDDQIAMKVHDKTGYFSGASGNQYYTIKWQPPGASSYEDIPVGVLCCKSQDIPDEYFTLSSPVFLTSNTSDPNWIVSASGEKYSDTKAWCAFAPGNSWRSYGGAWGTGGGVPAWIQWQNLNKKVLVKRYTILSSGYECIHDWTLQGSNDGNTWDILDTQSISSFPANSTKEFIVSSNNTSYYYHRLYITSSGDSDCPIGEIKSYSK